MDCDEGLTFPFASLIASSASRASSNFTKPKPFDLPVSGLNTICTSQLSVRCFICICSFICGHAGCSVSICSVHATDKQAWWARAGGNWHTLTDKMRPYLSKNSRSFLSVMSIGRLPTNMLPTLSSRPLLGVSLSGLLAPLLRGDWLLERDGEYSTRRSGDAAVPISVRGRLRVSVWADPVSTSCTETTDS